MTEWNATTAEENWFAYDKFDLETGRRTPLETASGITQLSCDGGESSASTAPLVRLIPSPTGNLIARFAATTDCDERRYTISFLDAFEYTPISSPIEVFERSEELRSDGTDFWPMFDGMDRRRRLCAPWMAPWIQRRIHEFAALSPRWTHTRNRMHFITNA